MQWNMQLQRRMTTGTLILIKSEIHIIQARGRINSWCPYKVILGLKWAVGQVEGQNLNDEKPPKCPELAALRT